MEEYIKIEVDESQISELSRQDQGNAPMLGTTAKAAGHLFPWPFWESFQLGHKGVPRVISNDT